MPRRTLSRPQKAQRSGSALATLSASKVRSPRCAVGIGHAPLVAAVVHVTSFATEYSFEQVRKRNLVSEPYSLSYIGSAAWGLQLRHKWLQVHTPARRECKRIQAYRIPALHIPSLGHAHGFATLPWNPGVYRTAAPARTACSPP